MSLGSNIQEFRVAGWTEELREAHAVRRAEGEAIGRGVCRVGVCLPAQNRLAEHFTGLPWREEVVGSIRFTWEEREGDHTVSEREPSPTPWPPCTCAILGLHLEFLF